MQLAHLGPSVPVAVEMVGATLESVHRRPAESLCAHPSRYYARMQPLD
jgi:hypothetical protein